jgi:repressor LexA
MEIDEIKARMAAKGYGQADLANVLGIDPSAVSKRLTGKRPFKHHEMIKTEAWLGGHTPDVPISGDAVRMVPVVGIVTAGNWLEAIQQPSGHLPFAAADTPRNAIALRVYGDSMDLEIDDGGTVMVDLDDKALFPGKLFVVLNGEGETTFKQFENDPPRLIPRSSNPAYRPIEFGDGQPFTVVGRVTALYKRR